MRAFAAVLVLVAAGCVVEEAPVLGTTAAALGATIDPPATAMERPARVYVLPVLYLPSGQWSAASGREYAAAKQNLGVHLRVAQKKYALMIANPATGADRGSFGLATWDYDEGNTARVFDSENGYPEPLKVYSGKAYENLGAGTGGVEEEIYADVLDAVGCQAQSCPFIFVTMVAHPDRTAINGTPTNYGHNGGGGYVTLGLDHAARSHLMSPSSPYDLAPTLQSVLLHELGHSFGLRHMSTYSPPAALGVTHLPPASCAIDDYGDTQPGVLDKNDSTVNCTADQINAYCNGMGWARGHWEFHCSYSVMSYYKLNGTRGCLASDASGLCAYPSPDSVVSVLVPGELTAENLHHLALNELVFPDLAEDFDLLADDDDGDNSVLWHDGNGAPDLASKVIPGHLRLTASSPYNNFGSAARASFGYHGKPIEPASTTFNKLRNWHSTSVGAGGWVYVDFNFPEDVSISRVRAYTGYDNGTHEATDIEVRKGSGGALVSCGSGSFGGRFDGETAVSVLGSCYGGKPTYRILLKAGPSGYVVVRGIRFWDLLGNELQAPRMPIATSGYTAYGSSPQNVVGWDQFINAAYHQYDAGDMWHSQDVGATNWASLDIRLPNFTTIASMSFYTGYTSASGGFNHPATRVQIEYRDGNGNYVAARNVAIGAYGMVNITQPIFATHLRIAFKTGSSGHVVVRGIRMFRDFNGVDELYTPLYEYENYVPLL